MADGNFTSGDIPVCGEEPESTQIEVEILDVAMEEKIEEPVIGIGANIIQSLVEVTADLMDVFWDSEEGQSITELNISERTGAEGEGHPVCEGPRRPDSSQPPQVPQLPLTDEETQETLLLISSTEASRVSEEYTEDDLTPSQASMEYTDTEGTSGVGCTENETRAENKSDSAPTANNMFTENQIVNSQIEHSDDVVSDTRHPSFEKENGVNLSDNLNQKGPKELEENEYCTEESPENEVEDDDSGDFQASQSETPQNSSDEPGISGIQGAEQLNRLAPVNQVLECEDELEICDPDLDDTEHFEKPLQDALRNFLESQLTNSDSELEVEVPILRESSSIRETLKEQFPLQNTCFNSEEDVEDGESLLPDYSEGSVDDIHLDTVDLAEPDDEEVLEYCVKNTKIMEMHLSPEVPSEVSIINYSPIVQNSETSTQDDSSGNIEQEDDSSGNIDQDEPSVVPTEPECINIIPTDYTSDSDSTQALAGSSHTAFEDRRSVIDNVDSTPPESRDTSVTTLKTSTDSVISGEDIIESSSAESRKIDVHATNSAHDNGFRYSWDRSNTSHICQRPDLTFRVEIRKLNFPMDVSAQINKDETPKKTEIRKLRYPWNEQQPPPIDETNILDDFPEVVQELDLKDKNVKSENTTDLYENERLLAGEVSQDIDCTSCFGLSNESALYCTERNSGYDSPWIVNPNNSSLSEAELAVMDKQAVAMQNVESVHELACDSNHSEDQDNSSDSLQVPNVDNVDSSIERSPGEEILDQTDVDYATFSTEESGSAGVDHNETNIQPGQHENILYTSEADGSCENEDLEDRAASSDVNFDSKDPRALSKNEDSNCHQNEIGFNLINEVPSELKAVSKQSDQQDNQPEKISSKDDLSQDTGGTEYQENNMKSEVKHSHPYRDLVYVQRMGFTCLKLGPAAIFSSTTSPTAPVAPELLEDLSQVTGQLHYRKLIPAIDPENKESQEQKSNNDQTVDLPNDMMTVCNTNENNGSEEVNSNLQNTSVHSLHTSKDNLNELTNDSKDEICRSECENANRSEHILHSNCFELLEIPPDAPFEIKNQHYSVGDSNVSYNDTSLASVDAQLIEEEITAVQKSFADQEIGEAENPDSGYDTMVNSENISKSSVNIQLSESRQASCHSMKDDSAIDLSTKTIPNEQDTTSRPSVHSLSESTETIGECNNNEIAEKGKLKIEYDPENLRTAVIVAQNTEANILKIINVLMQAQELEGNAHVNTVLTENNDEEMIVKDHTSETSENHNEVLNPQIQTMRTIVKDFIDSQFKQNEFAADDLEVSLDETIVFDGLNITTCNDASICNDQNAETENISILDNCATNCCLLENSSAIEENEYLENEVSIKKSDLLINSASFGENVDVEKLQSGEIAQPGNEKSVPRNKIEPFSEENKKFNPEMDIQINAGELAVKSENEATNEKIINTEQDFLTVSTHFGQEDVSMTCEADIDVGDTCRVESEDTGLGSVINSATNITNDIQTYGDIDEDLYRGDDDIPFPQPKDQKVDHNCVVETETDIPIENLTYSDIEENKYRSMYKGKDIDAILLTSVERDGSSKNESNTTQCLRHQCEIEDLSNGENRINAESSGNNIATYVDKKKEEHNLNAMEKLEITERFLESLETKDVNNEIEEIDGLDDSYEDELYPPLHRNFSQENAELESGSQSVCNLGFENSSHEGDVNNIVDNPSAKGEKNAFTIKEHDFPEEMLENNAGDEAGKDSSGTFYARTALKKLQVMKETVEEYQKLVGHVCPENGKDSQKEHDIVETQEIHDTCNNIDNTIETGDHMNVCAHEADNSDQNNLKIQTNQGKTISQDGYQLEEADLMQTIESQFPNNSLMHESGAKLDRETPEIGQSDDTEDLGVEEITISAEDSDNFIKDELKENECIEIVDELDMQKCKEVCMENEMVNFSSEIINESCENIFIVDELNVAESSAVATNIEIPNEVLLNAEEEEEDVDERAIMNAQCQGIVEEIVASVEGGYNLEIPSESELVIENRDSVSCIEDDVD